MASRVPGTTRNAVTSAGAGAVFVVMRKNDVLFFPCSCRYISYCKEKRLAAEVYESNWSSIAKSIRVVSMVCAAARKCHAKCPKKARCSTTDVSIFAALTAYFENKTRYSSISPARNGTGAAAGATATGVAGAFARDLGRLDF